MALCVGNLARSTLKLMSNNAVKQLMVNATRQLYSMNSMGINGYLNSREYVKTQFHNLDHIFYDKMKSFVESKDSTSMIFTEDLKTMMHIIDKKPEDLELLYKMMVQYKSQNNLRFGSFVFGTVAMRMFYHLDEPDLALKAFMNPELDGFFDQIMSHQILLDLLYNHGRYDDVKAVYNVTKSKNINGIVHPKNPFIIVMAACYKQNTPESYQYAIDLFKEANSRGYDFPRRSISFLGSLALKQNDPGTALEVVSLARNVRYIDIRCIKVVAFAQLKRLDEVIIFFRESLQTDSITKQKQAYFRDTIEEVEKYIEEEKFDENSDIVKMINQLKVHEFIQTGTMDEHICSTIDSVKVVGKPWQSQGNERVYQNRNNDRFGYNKSRQGLRDRI